MLWQADPSASFRSPGEPHRRRRCQGKSKPSDQTASIPQLIGGRKWLFSEDAYHVDVSHLAAVVRSSILVRDPQTLALALELCEYGKNLSDRHKYEGLSPFDKVYEDHAVYLGALLGKEVDAAIEHFEAKVETSAAEAAERGYAGQTDSLPAQVLVLLLSRLGRFDQAIDVFAERLADMSEASLICPGLSSLCSSAGRLDRLAEISKSRGDLATYLAAKLQDAERRRVRG